jgi:hypothetical protein
LIETPRISQSSQSNIEEGSRSPSQRYGVENSENSFDFSDSVAKQSPVAKDISVPFAMLNNFGAIKEVSDEEDNSSTSSFDPRLPKNTQSSPLKKRRYRAGRSKGKNGSKRDKERRKFADPISIKPAYIDLFKEK